MSKKNFTSRINGTDYEIVCNRKVVETLKLEHYDENEVADYINKCENAYKVITDIKFDIDRVIDLGGSYNKFNNAIECMVRNLDGSYHKFKNAVETLKQLDVPNYMSYDILDLKGKLIRMMVWVSTPLTTTEGREISMAIFGMMVNDLYDVRKTINKIVVE